MSAHTPGPWLAAAKPSSLGWPVVATANGQLICSMNYVHHSTVYPKVAGDDAFNREAVANARLIAAAPDLLAALQRFVDQARVGSGNKAVTRSARVNCPAGIYHDARAAIAKAVQS